ncbi:MAG: peptidase [Chloroflexi bacterium]|nr:MAG: peptidase [Chloroflexota bacterium]
MLSAPAALFAQDGATGQDAVHILEVRGVINPPVANYIRRALEDAAAQNARLAVIQLDTPGGLDSSTREITQAILAARVPVAVYVTPAGARAASAGLFILVSANVAAMAPSTNTGAAHPVGLGGDGQADPVMVDKVTNDAAATIRALATTRGRNAEWAEQAVRESVSITEYEALELNVIDVIARDLDHLLEQLHGRTVQTAAGEVTLDVANAPLYDASMNFAEQLLHIISTPDLAFILLSIGTIGLIAELYNPGTFIPGIVGVISLIFAFFALGNLPTNWAGVAFIVLAVVLLIAELNTDATGVLGTGATIAFLLGGLLLFRPLRPVSPTMPDLSVNPWVLAAATALFAGFLMLVITQLARTRKTPLLTGAEQYVGRLATTYQELAPRGRVWFESQLWNAVVQTGETVPAQQPVRIIGVDGLTLIVEPAPTSQPGTPGAPVPSGEERSR